MLDDADLRNQCHRWARGDKAATDFLVALSDVVRRADDICDGDTSAPHTDMALMVSDLLLKLTINEFYRRWEATFAPLISTIFLLWSHTDAWKSDEDAAVRTFGYVYRDAIEMVMFTTALLTGGPQHARACMGEMMDKSHRGQETPQEWERST